MGPSFSTWSDVTPYEHGVQAARSWLLAAQLSIFNKVVPSIPLSPWLDHQILCNYLSGAEDLAVDLASVAQADWPNCLTILRRVRAALDPPPRLIVYCGTSPRRIEQAYRSWRGRVMFVSRGPIDYAMRGIRLLPDLSKEPDWGPSREELISHNDQAFMDFVEGLTLSQLYEEERPVMLDAGYGT